MDFGNLYEISTKKLIIPSGIQKCSAHKSGSSLCGMRSDGNPARLWPATQRHFLCPWGSGLPARAISFMENPGLFLGFIKIDAKTNKTHGFEHFTCNPLRDPIFRKIAQNGISWITVRINLFINGTRKPAAMLSSRALFKDLLQYLAITTTFGAWGHGSKKVDGGERFRQLPRLNPDNLFFISYRAHCRA